MKKIIIETIPQNKQRYATIGDWEDLHDTLHIRVSDMGDWRYEALVAIHELIEVVLSTSAGITTEQVDKFDFVWDNEANYDESGDDPACPCHDQHVVATNIERQLAHELNVDWYEYANVIDNTYKGGKN